MKDTKESVKDFLDSFAHARRGTVSHEGQTFTLNLPAATARQLGFEGAFKIAIGDGDNLQDWEDNSKLLRLLEEEISGLPKFFRCRYRAIDSAESALTFFKNSVRGFKGAESELEQLQCEVLRCMLKVSFQGGGLTEGLQVGIAIPMLNLCRIENDPQEIQADLLAPFNKSGLDSPSTIWALGAIFSSLEEEILPQYEALKDVLRKDYNDEKKWLDAFYEDLLSSNSEVQGLQPPAGGPRERLESEQSQIIASLKERYKPRVRFEPVTLCTILTSCYVFRTGEWAVAKLPLSKKLFSTGCSLCTRMLDTHYLQGENIYCAICKQRSTH